MAIKFLSTIDQWKDFSNLASYPIVIDGVTWKSVEHYYQFKKFERIDPSLAHEIKNASTPKQAKRLSMQNGSQPSNWDDIKVNVLRTAVEEKFKSYSHLRDLLMSTGDEKLIEANPDDYFWGIGADGSGKNVMGEILMEIRDCLKDANVSTV